MTYQEQLKRPEWQRKRLEIMQRDDFQCQICFDRDSTLVVHHKRYEKGKMAWEYDSRDLLTICENCHDTIHDFYEKMEFGNEFCVNTHITKTDFAMLFARFKDLHKQEGDRYIERVNQLLTAWVIKKEDL